MRLLELVEKQLPNLYGGVDMCEVVVYWVGVFGSLGDLV